MDFKVSGLDDSGFEGSELKCQEFHPPEFIVPEWPCPQSVKSCISTRVGGCCQAPFDGFNLALHVGDNSASVMQNRQHLAHSLQLPPIQWLNQVHGTAIVRAESGNNSTAKSEYEVLTADGCVTDEIGVTCSVLTADCLPVLMCDRSGNQVGAIHAGWRGLAAGILGKAVSCFKGPPQDLLVYLGPAISQKYFEVGKEVLEVFLESARSEEHSQEIKNAFVANTDTLTPAVVSNNQKLFADLYALARAELKAVGVTSVWGGNLCSFADSQRFYSYRRDGQTGRMASLIWLQQD